MIKIIVICTLGDDIVGLSVSVRERDDIIQIWNRDSRLSENSTILEKVKQLLPDVQFFTVFYKGDERIF